MRFFRNTRIFVAGLITIFAVTPAVALAQLNGIQSLLASVDTIVNVLIPLVMALALLAFFWGLVQALFSGGEEAKKKGRPLMIWGIIILFVMVAVWGIIQFIAGNLGVTTGGSIQAPTVQTTT
ncbi:MAG: hypothetical protein ACREGH_03270 [Minisyncoccia bacterium]